MCGSCQKEDSWYTVFQHVEVEQRHAKAKVYKTDLPKKPSPISVKARKQRMIWEVKIKNYRQDLLVEHATSHGSSPASPAGAVLSVPMPSSSSSAPPSQHSARAAMAATACHRAPSSVEGSGDGHRHALESSRDFPWLIFGLAEQLGRRMCDWRVIQPISLMVRCRGVQKQPALLMVARP